MADHATTTIPGLTQARIQAIAALAVNLISTISAGLALAGLNPLPFTSDQVSAAVLGVIAVISAVYNWWTHNVVTDAAYEGAQVTNAIKLAKRSGNTADQPEVSEAVATDATDSDDANGYVVPAYDGFGIPATAEDAAALSADYPEE
ncbi:SPP1 phage holin family protein [Bifidobacterium amazonense]|uniref:SPP1 phage holin family protein n=1 Tax=Bifidobacterium amazonense TaxID=2809027 RepID=A0ABS9VST1_9BIFI|nr:phage holin [Bifidobacterium amazonense]MCH9275016.1 SPP1 phage holin family protein [Bifidobacterium amazonense]